MPLLLVVLLLKACKDPATGAETSSEETPFFSMDSLPGRVSLNPKAVEITRDWTTFNDLDAGFNSLSIIENYEDLVLVLEDLVERQKKVEEGEYPEAFDLPQVKSRQKVVKTFLLKTRAAAEYRIDATPPAIEMMKAYNALRTQLNVIVNNQLDTLLITDE
ncbi:hypothetical protein GCM10011361_13550 [Muriicola marianensis]|uniref:Uncharacterized protein n=2 Tax=Muriicola marianensis TaxID=1324801 RepID=A0ABQ1QY60_9FLAO|nr:hypothetical protein GCM10011361_13550 [Muriicola marianensis]